MDFLLSACLPLLALASSSTTGLTQTSSSIAGLTPSIDALSTPTTCPFRTVNYLTHTLPQQCLRTSRSTSNATAEPWQTPGSIITLGGPSERENSSESHVESADLGGHGNETSAPPQGIASSQLSADPSTATAIETAPPARPSTAPDDLDVDGDSPLDNANFLSFEEWKKQNLEKSGQSPDNVGQSHSGATGTNDARRRPGINNALDSLGDDQEIELDFGGFGSPKKTDDGASVPSATGSNSGQDTVPVTSRSKDAGKTCKERFNYASFDCAATILKTNPKAKSASSVLVENKDSYMLNECRADNKFIIVELCDDILIDTVVLANFEFFSSMFRTFRLAISDRYPVKMERWRELGTFEARNSREVQAFLVENPLIWARYLRIEFLEHYGNEYYCPLSLVRVHGTTMLEEYRHQEEAARGEELSIEDVAEDVVKAEEANRREEDIKREERQSAIAREEDKKQDDPPTLSSVPSSETPSSAAGTERAGSSSAVAGNASTSSTGTIDQPPSHADTPSAVVFKRDPTPTCANPANPAEGSVTAPAPTSAETTFTGTSAGTNHTSPVTSSPPSAGPSSLSASEVSNTTQLHNDSSSRPSSSVSDSHSPTNTTASLKPSTSSASQNSTRPSPTHNPAPSPSPPTQESFFKSVHKRLQTLESNSTLSLQYIESQSRILRDAFASVQKKQLAKTTEFLHNLNTTVVGELLGFRQQYDQLWQSTVLELSDGRERQRREIEELTLRLRLLADEVVWQKRVEVVQGVLVLVCLAIAIFARGGVGAAGDGLEIPGRRKLGVRLPRESPERSPESSFRGRWGLGKRGSWFVGEDSAAVSRAMSEGEGDGEGEGEGEDDADEGSVRNGKGRSDGLLTPTDFSRPTTAGRSESPEPPPSARSVPKETQSSPATPSGMRDLQDGAQGWEEAIGEGSAGRGEESAEHEEQQSGEREGRGEAAKG